MNVFRKWMRSALLVMALATMTAALIVVLDLPKQPHQAQKDWLVWMTIMTPLYTSGTGGCRWVARRFGTTRPQGEH